MYTIRALANDCVYIHEFIDIVGHARAAYMQHMTANWSPIGQEERGQRCFGVWAVLGSTGRWPQVVNIWEHDGWDGLAGSFEVETGGGTAGAQDPALARWWAKAAELRSGGTDRILVPAPWTPPITELCASGVRGRCYAHELVRVRPGSAAELLERVQDGLAPLGGAHGWSLVGAWRTAMVDDDECVLLWAIPSWPAWAAFEAAGAGVGVGDADGDGDGDVRAWRAGVRDIVERWQRIVLVDAPLSPLRTGRQPSRSDRTDWTD